MSSSLPVEPEKPKEMKPRAAERTKVDVPIAYSFETRPQKSTAISYRWGRLIDISDRGLCFKAADTFVPERLISLQLKLSDQSSGIRMFGKIVWTAPDSEGMTRVGVQFVGKLPSDWHSLVPGEKRVG